ncbi:MAG: glycosyltransferase [Flavobacteriales bacterium]|nr:glycosyltransferase [Flavobacteriales bacterium]
MKSSTKVIVSVSTDLSSDQRVLKVCESLMKQEYEVSLLGRHLKTSKVFLKNYKSQRFKLWFNTGALFYANLNIRLFLKLMSSKVEVLYANDLDVLPANYLAAKLKKKPLIYDSHEYFTEVPELLSKPSVRRFWERIEQRLIPNLKHCITVTPKIASVYQEKYGVEFKVIRNFPILGETKKADKLDYIIYQGALNVGRGIEELIAAMPKVNAKLWIAGEGDIEHSLKEKVQQLNLQERVVFLGRVDPLDLKEYTRKAKLGVSIEKKLGLSYTYALPNKIFDYLHAATPILYADLIEVKETLKEYAVGEELQSYEPDVLARQLNLMLESNEYEMWKENCLLAAKEFNWQEEEKVLLSIFGNLST